MKRVLNSCAVGVLVALAGAAFPSTSRAQVSANGAGQAVFTVSESGTPLGTVTEFGLNAMVAANGSAMGQFACWVSKPGGGGLTAKITGGKVVGNTLVLTGTSTCVFFKGGGVFRDEPIQLTVRPGGPGVGGFTLCFPNFGFCDTEVITKGSIRVK